MKDHPVIFSAQMILALLENRKRMTRRLAHRKTRDGIFDLAPSPWQHVKPGDLLWVREACINDVTSDTWKRRWLCEADRFACFTSSTRDRPGRRAGMHMPRMDSRLTLEVTAVKTEKLQEISEEDARAEGAVFHDGGGVGHSGWRHDETDGYVFATARESFQRLWAKLHGEESWASNPELVALTFTIHRANIDTFMKQGTT